MPPVKVIILRVVGLDKCGVHVEVLRALKRYPMLADVFGVLPSIELDFH
jgi:hypothetical protein